VQARAKERGGPPGYDGFCRDRGVGQGPTTALRFRSPDDGATSFDDLIRGTVTVENRTLEDFVLLRSSGTPTFLLANVVDDADMGITHVVRGEEHVNGTPKYLCLGDALGLDHRPVFAHVPVLVNESRQKLSKRRDSVSVQDFKDQGYLPEAMVNYLALLGWGPKDGVEVRPLSEILELFRLEDVTSSPAFFDTKKLQAFNADHLRALRPDEFVDRARPFLTRGEAAEAALRPIAELVQERVRLLTEVEPMVAFLLDEPLEIDDDSWTKAMVKGKAAPEMLAGATAGLDALEDWTAEAIRSAIEAAAVEAGLVNAEGQPQLSKAQGPVRVAATGRSVGPPLFESLEALGRDRTLERLRAAAARL
jgi:glutamyl-tRNA synthetase